MDQKYSCQAYLFGKSSPYPTFLLHLQSILRQRAGTFSHRPDIYRRRPSGQPDPTLDVGVKIHDWTELQRRRELDLLQAHGTMQPVRLRSSLAARDTDYQRMRQMMKTHRATKGKVTGGRTYTSKFRGVHQTFPTRRWEAQFRRNGKPTSLGCFDHEEEAARSYDKMMLWCELHNAVGVKGGITNFDPAEYEADIPWLQQVSQDDLVQILRSDGRRQAAARTVRMRKGSGSEQQQQQHSGFGMGVVPSAGTSTGPPSEMTL